MNFFKHKYILRIEGSTFCNQKCLFCPQDRCKLKNQIMPMVIYRNIIDSIYNLKIPISAINFSGMGEPLTDPLLFERLSYARKICKNFQFYTNGKLLVGKTLRRVNDNFTKVYFSFHGNTVEEYKKYTGNSFTDMQLIFKTAKTIMGSKLVLTNEPEGKLHELLDAGPVTPSSLHPIHNFGDEQLKTDLQKIGVHADMNGQRFCELNLFIIFRVDGSMATCCNDWDGENEILASRFPKCKRCFCSNHFQEISKNGSLASYMKQLRVLETELRRVKE